MKPTPPPRVLSSEFCKSSADWSECPPTTLPELALAGRSNVGKSTLLNRLCGRKALARTSATPGRTQLLNHFEVKLAWERGTPALMLTDLPGFGYARLPQTQRRLLLRLLCGYLEQRPQLQLLCLLNDCRRAPQEEELALRDLAFQRGLHFQVVLTKLDKIKAAERFKSIQKIAGGYGLAPEDLILSGTKHPAAAFWERVLPLLD